jgi:iron complex transport system substrate-binding protein
MAYPIRRSIIVLFSVFLVSCLAAQGAQVKPRWAEGFRVEYGAGWKHVAVEGAYSGSSERFEYLLLPRGAKRPAEHPKALVVEIPLERAASFSSSYVAAFSALGLLDRLAAVDSTAFVYDAALRELIESGKVREASANWQPDLELLSALKVDGVFTYGTGSEWDTWPRMRAAGLPVIMNGDWNEAHPLGRAEWIKFIALFFDAEAKANEVFDGIESAYLAVAEKAAKGASKPKVVVNAPFQGSWTVSGGKSYMARLLEAAGAEYLWRDKGEKGGVSLSVEEAYVTALKADLWLNPGAASSLKDLSGMDARFSRIPAFKKALVWNSDLRMSPGGGNDYFESGSLRADLVLADIAAIVNPELFPKHSFTYFRRLK